MGLHENTVMMRPLIAIAALVASVSAIAETQVPNVFEVSSDRGGIF